MEQTWFDGLEPSTPPQTIQGFQQLIDHMLDQRAKVDAAKARLTDEQTKLSELEAKVLNILDSNNMDNFRTERALVSVTHRFSVKTPKTPEAREQFFEYLKSKNLFDDMITVNSQTLTSFYRTEQENALDRGEVDFKMPGIEDATMVKTLSVRKGK